MIPRGLRRFFFTGTTSAKAINDDYNLFITATLPENFAYLMRSFNSRISFDTVADLDTFIAIRMLNHIPNQGGSAEETMHVLQNLKEDATSNSSRVSDQRDSVTAFAGPVWADPGGSAITFRAAYANIEDPAQATGSVTTRCEFYEYDLTQAQRFYINSPFPVISR